MPLACTPSFFQSRGATLGTAGAEILTSSKLKSGTEATIGNRVSLEGKENELFGGGPWDGRP